MGLRMALGKVLNFILTLTLLSQTEAKVFGNTDNLNIQLAAQEAEKQFGVPSRLLLAMAYADSRFQIIDQYEKKSWISFLPWRQARRIGKEIEYILKKSQAEIFANPHLGIKAEAIKLKIFLGAKFFTREESQQFDFWRDALSKWNEDNDPLADKLYLDQIALLYNNGFSGVDNLGKKIVIPPLKHKVDANTYLNPFKHQQDARTPGFVGIPSISFFKLNSKAYRPLAETPRKIKYIVIHTMQNSFATIFGYFRRPTTQVGGHYMIRALDGFSIQTADERIVAFHDACFNEESIGIEHEGRIENGKLWYTDTMYQASANIVKDIAKRHKIPLDRKYILGHSEAPDCSEHQDPGNDWDWEKYMKLLRQK